MTTAEEARKTNIAKMGEPLGVQYSALWQELTQLYWFWNEFVILYGTKKERVELANRAAGQFFFLVQEVLWEAVMLHLCRLTDPPQTGPQRTNLTIRNFPGLLQDQVLKAEVAKLIETAIDKTTFCRDWRNRRIAHRDLDLAIGESANPLQTATIEATRDALAAVASVLNRVESHFDVGQTAFNYAEAMHGAQSLLHVIHDGLTVHKQRLEQLQRGEIPSWPTPKDL